MTDPVSSFEWRRGRVIPLAEIRFEQHLGSGPGGQHVNRTATRVTLIWRPAESTAFDDAEREVLLAELAPRLTKRGELRLRCASERSARRNRTRCLELLGQLLRDALRPRRARKATRPTRASRERRLEAKRRRSRLKRERQCRDGE